jgi:hypothetical protein
MRNGNTPNLFAHDLASDEKALPGLIVSLQRHVATPAELQQLLSAATTTSDATKIHVDFRYLIRQLGIHLFVSDRMRRTQPFDRVKLRHAAWGAHWRISLATIFRVSIETGKRRDITRGGLSLAVSVRQQHSPRAPGRRDRQSE